MNLFAIFKIIIFKQKKISYEARKKIYFNYFS